MPRVSNRTRICKECNSVYELNVDGGMHVFCSMACRKADGIRRSTAYRQSDKGKLTSRRWRLKTGFNISLDEFDDMLASQDNSCAICLAKEPGGYNWHVDHCHSEGKVRGILCTQCNQGLGLLKDDPEIIRRAARYLDESRSTGK